MPKIIDFPKPESETLPIPDIVDFLLDCNSLMYAEYLYFLLVYRHWQSGEFSGWEYIYPVNQGGRPKEIYLQTKRINKRLEIIYPALRFCDGFQKLVNYLDQWKSFPMKIGNQLPTQVICFRNIHETRSLDRFLNELISAPDKSIYL